MTTAIVVTEARCTVVATRRCPSCTETLALEGFTRSKANPLGRQGHCRECAKWHHLEWKARHPGYRPPSRPSPSRPLRTARDYCADGDTRSVMRAYVELVKAGQPCADCGEAFPSAGQAGLHFHHVDRATKSFNVHEAPTLAALQDEIAKCVLLCRSCHGKRHWAVIPD